VPALYSMIPSLSTLIECLGPWIELSFVASSNSLVCLWSQLAQSSGRSQVALRCSPCVLGTQAKRRVAGALPWLLATLIIH
jgi:hypothetical protein